MFKKMHCYQMEYVKPNNTRAFATEICATAVDQVKDYSRLKAPMKTEHPNG